MKSLLYGLPGLAVMALAFWAYSENYETQQTLRNVSRLQSAIGTERELQAVLRAEWAYLNRPARLKELTDMNFDRLQLLPLAPAQFADVDQVAYPPAPGELSALTTLSSDGLVP